MPIDFEKLAQHRAHVDVASGLQEEFVEPTLAGVKTVGVMARPVGEVLPVGWVVCHSFGLEQMNLDRVDVTVARGLAASGFPVLRFHAPGYGDSARRGSPVDHASHVEATIEAVALMARQPGVERVGVLGARFGGMVAALVADSAGLPLLAMWQPFMRGSAFIRDSMQTAFLTEMLEKARGSQGGLEADLAGKGWADVSGFVLSREAFDAVSAVDLATDVTRFAGNALVVGVSRTGAMPAEAAKVAGHIRSLGATCEEAAVKDKWAQLFGQHQFRSLPGGETEIDTQYEVSRAIAETAARWARAHL
jgi:hypothetical protein